MQQKSDPEALCPIFGFCLNLLGLDSRSKKEAGIGFRRISTCIQRKSRSPTQGEFLYSASEASKREGKHSSDWRTNALCSAGPASLSLSLSLPLCLSHEAATCLACPACGEKQAGDEEEECCLRDGVRGAQGSRRLRRGLG
eukprot:947218-Rhodomonas_salina.2